MKAEEKLKYEIHHIFDSGANEIRVFDLCKRVNEQTRREERERLENDIRRYRSVLTYIAKSACEQPDTVDVCHNLLANIQLDASWALREGETK